MKQIDMIQPTVMAEPLAANGPRNTIPAEATGTEYASVDTGFPQITMTAISDGGLPPRGEDCNGMFYMSTDQKVYLQNGGVITFSEEVSNTIGGYPQNAILDYIDSNNVYHKVQSLIDDNTYNFVTNPEYINDEYWKEISTDTSNALNTSQITNCLLEVPQNIKLELADGVLTLKAGSTYILPNGKDTFEHITISEDLTRSKFGNGSHENLYIQMYVPNSTGIGGLSFVEPSNITVGTEQPASGMWYNTTTNQIINYTSSGAEDAIRSFPIAVVKTESGVVTEIKEVLNGIGHFGSVIFADKGIKGLIPNGRNEDGTLNNIEFKTDKVLVHNITENKTGWELYLSSSHLTKSTAINYDSITNYNIHPTIGNYLYCQIGTFDTSSTNFAVSNFRVKEPFRAVDYNDFKKLHVNIPYFFGMYQWFERDPENLSWLKSNGQWNSGTGYQDFYNWALAKVNAGTSGFALSTASYTDYDFVVNTSAKTFRLPIKVKGRIGEAVVGNGNIMTFEAGYDSSNSGIANYMALGRTNKSGDYGTVLYNLNGDHFNSTQTGDVHSIPTSTTAYNNFSYGGVNLVGLSQNPTYSGLELDTTGLSLYFYVGETIRDEFLINVGEIASNIADKVEVVEAYVNGSSGYRVYSADSTGKRYCEQWGYVIGDATSEVTFLKSFLDTNYNSLSTLDSSNSYGSAIIAKTATSMTVHTQAASKGAYWRACGYID